MLALVLAFAAALVDGPVSGLELCGSGRALRSFLARESEPEPEPEPEPEDPDCCRAGCFSAALSDRCTREEARCKTAGAGRGGRTDASGSCAGRGGELAGLLLRVRADLWHA